MDKEKYDKAITIHERIQALTRTRNELESCRLTFVFKCSNGEESTIADWYDSPIKELLAAHAEKIKQEISEEISALHREIEEL